MIPKEVMDECRREAEKQLAVKKPRNWVAGAIIISIWLGIAIILVFNIIK